MPYAVWRPQLVAHMMRVGIEERHYSEEITNWSKIVSAVAELAASDEKDAV